MPKSSPMPFHASLAALLAQAAPPAPKRRAGPGRPTKIHAEVQPVLLHLYKDQVRWLDDYAAHLAQLSPGNARLSRVEIVRALLTALAEHALHRRLTLPPKVPIRTESDLRTALVQALDRAAATRPRRA